MIELRPDVSARFAGQDPFDAIMRLEGEVFRALENRRTIRWDCGDKAYFVKIHHGVGWKEIFKNLLSLRLPVVGASNEYHAIKRLESLGIQAMTVAGYGQRGGNPARQESFLVTDELQDVVSLEEFCADWVNHPPAPALKRRLIEAVARIARTIHEDGINHRDFYICHFMMTPAERERLMSGERPELTLIDLHRAQIRSEVPMRWLVKDLGGLLFSTLDLPMTFRDYCRFVKTYSGLKLRDALAERESMWRSSVQRAQQIYQRDFSRLPKFPDKML